MGENKNVKCEVGPVSFLFVYLVFSDDGYQSKSESTYLLKYKDDKKWISTGKRTELRRDDESMR